MEPMFNQVQPLVVTRAPDAKDVKAMVANTQKLIAAWPRSFFFGRPGFHRQRGAAGEEEVPAHTQQEQRDQKLVQVHT